MTRISSVADLEDAVGARSAAAQLKSIPVLDEHCAEFLARATFVVLGVQDERGEQRVLPLGGEHGKVAIPDPAGLRLEITGDVAALGVPDGSPAGLVALVPGYRETLRVNGRLRGSVLHVEEAFLHCAKCMIRSDLWDEHPPSGAEQEVADGDLTDPVIADFVGRARFAAIVSTDGTEHTDVSPKGDPAGFLTVVAADALAVPDRPGNRRTDTLHNLVEHPSVALVGLVPGDDRVLRVRGRARITRDPDLCARMETRGNVPKVALVIEEATASLELSPALRAAGLWDRARHVADGELPRASRIWTDHVRLNETPGVAARLARAAISERVMRAGLAVDYKSNLY